MNSSSHIKPLRFVSAKARRIIARIFLTLGTLCPGLALSIAPNTWGASPLFHQMAGLPVPLQFFGVSLVLASLLMVIGRFRDIGYVWAAMFFLVANISGGFSLAQGNGTSALIFTLPVLLWVYLEAAISANREGQEDIDLIAENDTEGG